MPNTKLTKKKLANHFQYGKMIYIALALVAWMAGDLVFSVTEYRPPNERRVHIEVVGGYIDSAGLERYAVRGLEAGQQYERERDLAVGEIVVDENYQPPLEEVEFFPISYDTNDNEDVYGPQKYMVTVAAQEGDVYILNRLLMEQMVNDGIAAPLNEYIEAGILRPGDLDLSRVTYPDPMLGEDGLPSNEEYVYAIPVSRMYGWYAEDVYYDVSDKYMVITTFSENKDTAAAVMQAIIDIAGSDEEIPEGLNIEGLKSLEEADTADDPFDMSGGDRQEDGDVHAED